MENDIINGHKEYSSYQNGVKLNSKTELFLRCKKSSCIKIYLALPKCTLKALSKDITAIFNLFYKKI